MCLGISGEAYAYHDISLAHVKYLLEHFACTGGVDYLDIIEHDVEVENDKTCQNRCGACADNVDVLCLNESVNGGVELFLVDLVKGLAYLLDIEIKDPAENVLACQLVVHNVHTLNGGELVAGKFLERLLHFGIALKAQLRCKTNNGGFAYPYDIAEL